MRRAKQIAAQTLRRTSPPTPPKPPRTRKQKILDGVGSVLGALGLSGVFVASLGAAVVLHINLPVTRRVASDIVTRTLSGVFHGSIGLGTIERLNLRGATVSEVTVKDPEGNTVIVLSDLRVRTDVLKLLDDVLTAEEKLTIVIRRVRAERAEVTIIPDPETGIPSIARTFTPIPSPTKEPSEPSEPSRPIRVWLPNIDISRIYGRGTVAGLPTMEVTLSGVRGSVLATPKGAAVDVQRYGMIVRGLGGTDATGTGEVHVRAPGAVWSSFDGYFGNLPLTASVYVKGNRVTASADIPRAMPEDVRALVMDWPLQEPVSAHLEASGDLPVLQTSARFEVGEGRIKANGPVRFAPQLGIDLDVEGRQVDIRAIWPKAPKTSVDTDAAISIFTKDGQVVVDVNGTTAPTKIAGQSIPAMDVTGTFNDKGFDGKATLHESGMPVKAAFTIHPDGAIDVDATARPFQLEKAPRVGQLTTAKGRAEMHVKARIEKNRLDATMVADVRNFKLGDVALDKGRITGKASGPIAEPEKLTIDAKIDGTELSAGGMSFDKVAATAKGPAARPRVQAKLTDQYGPEVNAKAILETKNNPGVRDLELEVKREDATVSGRISRLDFDQKEVTLQNLKLTGAGGELGGEIRVGKGFVAIKAKGDGLDLDVISRAIGLPKGMLGGKVNLDADVVASRAESRGHVRVGLGNGSIASVGGVSLNLDAKLDGQLVSGNASAIVEGFGKVGASWAGELDGSADDPRSWKRITGQTEIQASDLELSVLKHVLPKSARIEKIAGTAFARVRVERLAPEELPNLRVELAGTRGLEVVRTAANEKDPPLEIKGIEIEMNGAVHGERGDAAGTTLLRDRLGTLLSASGTVHMDLRKLLEPAVAVLSKEAEKAKQKKPAKKPGGDDTLAVEEQDLLDRFLEQLTEAPLMAVVVVPERSFEQLPELIRPVGLTGTIGGRVMLSGSFSEPRVGTSIEGRAISTTATRRAMPVDMRGTAEYEVSTGRYAANVEVCTPSSPIGACQTGARRVARLASQGHANIVDGTWTGGASVLIEQAPLGLIPVLAEGRVSGNVNGRIVLQRDKATEPPAIGASLELSDARVDMLPVGKGQLTVRSDGKQLRAQGEIEDQRGRVALDARAALTWDSLIPALDQGRPVKVDVTAHEFDAVVLSPFLRDLFSRLTGQVNGQLAATFTPKKDGEGKPTGEWETEVDGFANMQNGVVQIAPLGLEFRNVSMRARANEQGKFTVIDIQELTGQARSDRPNLKATAKIYMEGVRVVRGTGAMSVSNVPIVLEGVSLASATGLATLKLEREDERMVVTVDIPTLTAKLPQATSRSVVSLGDNPQIEVVQPMREPRRASTGEILPWHLVINLQRDVRLRRSDLNLPLTGQPIIDLGRTTDVSGYVELEPGGRFQSWGKTFVVETGRVRFDTPDPSNPHVTATASWRGPDGTIVYLDLRGTLKEAKLSLSSDPARSEPEIMALLFGASSSTDETSAARSRETAAAGGIATGFNTLFADTLGGNVELRTATQEDKASYTAAVRVSENVWFEGTYRNRLEAQQETAGTEAVDVSGTIDWRFRRNWSLRTEVGTLGTGLDLLWQYRY